VNVTRSPAKRRVVRVIETEGVPRFQYSMGQEEEEEEPEEEPITIRGIFEAEMRDFAQRQGWDPGAVNLGLEIGKAVAQAIAENSFYGDDAAAAVRDALGETRRRLHEQAVLKTAESFELPAIELEMETVEVSTPRIRGIDGTVVPILVPFNQGVTLRAEGEAHGYDGFRGLIPFVAADGIGVTCYQNIEGTVEEVDDARIMRSGIARSPLNPFEHSGVDQFNVQTTFPVVAGQVGLAAIIIGSHNSLGRSHVKATLTFRKPTLVPLGETIPEGLEARVSPARKLLVPLLGLLAGAGIAASPFALERFRGPTGL
jgi:hypothetical protein